MFPLAGMKNSLKNIWNNGRKWFPLAIIRLVFKKWFLLISVTVSASKKELSSKVDVFHYIGNPSPIAVMNDSLKNTFPLYGETTSSGKRIKNGFHLQENIFLLKFIPPNFNHGFQQQKKDSKQKHTVSTRQKIIFH